MTCLNFHVGICIFPLSESVSQHLRWQEFGRLTIISVTHHLHTLEYCDMVVHLKNGGSIDRIERLELALEKCHLLGGGSSPTICLGIFSPKSKTGEDELS